MSLLKSIVTGNTNQSSFESVAYDDITREFSFELASLESSLREFEQTTDLIYSIESLTREFFSKGDTITEYEAHLFQVSIEASFTAAGVDVPSELIVPSFEAAEATADAKEKVDDKKESLLKRLYKWLGEKLRAVAAFFKRMLGRFQKADEAIDKKVDNLKAKAKAAENGHAQLQHDPDGKKGAFYKDTTVEKDRGNHGRSDSDGNHGSYADAVGGGKKEDDKPAAKEVPNVKRSLSKTVLVAGGAGANISADVLRTFTGSNGKPVDLHQHIGTVLTSIDSVVEEFKGFIEASLKYSKSARDGAGAQVSDKDKAAGTKQLMNDLGLGSGKVEFAISPCAKVVVVDETRSSGIKLKVRTDYAYTGTLPSALPRIGGKEANAILRVFDEKEAGSHSGKVRWGKIEDKLEEAAKIYDDLAATYKGAGNKTDAEKLKAVGAVMTVISSVPSTFERVRYNSINGVLNYLDVCLYDTTTE